MNSDYNKRMYAKKLYGPLLDKNLRSVLKRELLTNFGFGTMGAIADLLIDRFLKIIEESTRPKESLLPYQTIVLAVDKYQRRGKGKTMAMTRLKPIILNLMTIDEQRRLADGETLRTLRIDMCVRMMKEADAQEAVLSYNDFAVLTGVSPNGVGLAKKEYLRQHPDEIVPHAGTVFDMGTTLTHKKLIIEEHLKCLLTTDIAAKTDHHSSNVDKYIGDFNRILDLYEDGKDEKQIAFLTGLSRSLVKEHVALIQEFKATHKLRSLKPDEQQKNVDKEH